MTAIRKFYGQTSFGQIHARLAASAGDEFFPPLLCLHPAPSSGLYFSTAMPMLNEGRRVIAPDYPGYGGSDSLPAEPAIADYALAMLEFLDDVGIEGAIDVLGFHTGCFVGAELALQQASKVRRLLLCDVPYFPPIARPGLLEKMALPMPLGKNLHSLQSVWDFNVTSRLEDVPMPRTIELLAEHLRAGRNDCFAFAAAFKYAAEVRLPQLQTETTVLATKSMLHAQSLEAAALIPGAALVEADDVTTAVFEAGAAAICRHINHTLL